MKAPNTYDEATESNPLRFGVNSARNDRMWVTRCDGMPTLMGCSAEIVHSVPYVRASMRPKPSGWLICYGINDDRSPDKRIVLAFCPKCAGVVLGQESRQ